MLLNTAHQTIARRTLLARGGGALAGLALLDTAFAKAFALQSGEEVIPWLDQPPPFPPGADPNQNLQLWEDLGSFITPNDKFFSIAHYERPAIDAQSWSLEIAGWSDNHAASPWLSSKRGGTVRLYSRSSAPAIAVSPSS
jgi:hypothetical protein